MMRDDVYGTAARKLATEQETALDQFADQFTTQNGAVGPQHAPTLLTADNVDSVAAELKRTPFFMTSLEDAGDADDNVELDAMRALAYEGTRLEIAENFRQQGNEAAKVKDWGNGKDFYGKAVVALRTERKNEEFEEFRRDVEGEGEGESRVVEGEGNEDLGSRGADEMVGKKLAERLKEEDRKEAGLKEICLVNRALCHLGLKNYRSCMVDCVATLDMAPRNVKAHYRLGQAMSALGKLEEARKACAGGLQVDPSNAALLKLRDDVLAKQKVADDKARKGREEQERKVKAQRTLGAALVARQIKLRKTGQPPPILEDAVIHLSPDPLSPESLLVFPVIILYPMHAQTDFIKAFGEEQSLGEHLSSLLPPPWDEKKQYTPPSVEAYVETREGGLVKWGRKVELLRLLMGKVDVVDGMVTANIVPKNMAATWIAEFKKRKGRG